MATVDVVKWFTSCLYRWACWRTQKVGGSWRLVLFSSVFTTWTEWTVAMALAWWQHYKHCSWCYFGGKYASCSDQEESEKFSLPFCTIFSGRPTLRTDQT